MRQVNNIKASQEHELQAIEEAQKSQFIEFSESWDKYMGDYETTAIKSLEKLKEKHLLEVEEAKKKMREEMKIKMKYSKALLEARKKEQTLVRLKKYDEAESVKNKADQLEMKERQKMDQDMQDQLAKRETKIKGQQQLALSALLKRIQRDRNEQLRQRQLDSQRFAISHTNLYRLIQRNKNLLNDLLVKHSFEVKKITECVKQTLDSAKNTEQSPNLKSQQQQTALPVVSEKRGAAISK